MKEVKERWRLMDDWRVEEKGDTYGHHDWKIIGQT